MSEANDRVLFLYLRDPNDPGHVATLARFKQGNVLTFSWAVNKITRSIEAKLTGKDQFVFATRTIHDAFKKSRGREIAEGRLRSEKSSVTIELHEGERPVRAMLETLSRSSSFRWGDGEDDVLKIPSFLSNWAAEELENLYIENPLDEEELTESSKDSV